MNEKEIKIGDKVVFRTILATDMYAIVENFNEYGGLRCRLIEPITHIEVSPGQVEVVSD